VPAEHGVLPRAGDVRGVVGGAGGRGGAEKVTELPIRLKKTKEKKKKKKNLMAKPAIYSNLLQSSHYTLKVC
jgi:hypothetical protein